MRRKRSTFSNLKTPFLEPPIRDSHQITNSRMVKGGCVDGFGGIPLNYFWAALVLFSSILFGPLKPILNQWTHPPVSPCKGVKHKHTCHCTFPFCHRKHWVGLVLLSKVPFLFTTRFIDKFLRINCSNGLHGGCHSRVNVDRCSFCIKICSQRKSSDHSDKSPHYLLSDMVSWTQKRRRSRKTPQNASIQDLPSESSWDQILGEILRSGSAATRDEFGDGLPPVFICELLLCSRPCWSWDCKAVIQASKSVKNHSIPGPKEITCWMYGISLPQIQ